MSVAKRTSRSRRSSEDKLRLFGDSSKDASASGAGGGGGGVASPTTGTSKLPVTRSVGATLTAAASPSSAPMVEVWYFRSRCIRMVVGTTTTAEQLIDRLKKEVYLEDFPTQYQLHAPGEPGKWLQSSDCIKDAVIWCCGRPCNLRLAVESADPLEPTKIRESVLLDLGSLPRHWLSEIRHRLWGSGKKLEPHLFRFGDELLNLNVPWSRQCVVEGAEIALVPVSSLAKKTLAQVVAAEAPSRRGWLRKRKSSKMISREQERYAMVTHRCLVYFKTDSPDAPVQGVIPLDYYQLAVNDADKMSFQLTATASMHMGVQLYADYAFAGSEPGWGAEIQRVKNVPLVFAVPWHWNTLHSTTFVRQCIEYLEEVDAVKLPNIFVNPQGSQTELVWFEELYDTGSMSKETLYGCRDPRTILSLFKRFFCLMPNPLLPRTLSTTLVTHTKSGASDEEVGRLIAATIRSIDSRAELSQFIDIFINTVMFLHKVACNSAANGATTLVLGRMFGPHLVHPRTGTPVIWQHLTATLIRVAPFIKNALDGNENLELTEMLLDEEEEVVVQELDVPEERKSPRDKAAYFHFGDVSGVEEVKSGPRRPPIIRAQPRPDVPLFDSDDEQLRYGVAHKRGGGGAPPKSPVRSEDDEVADGPEPTATPPPPIPVRALQHTQQQQLMARGSNDSTEGGVDVRALLDRVIKLEVMLARESQARVALHARVGTQEERIAQLERQLLRTKSLSSTSPRSGTVGDTPTSMSAAAAAAAAAGATTAAPAPAKPPASPRLGEVRSPRPNLESSADALKLSSSLGRREGARTALAIGSARQALSDDEELRPVPKSLPPVPKKPQ